MNNKFNPSTKRKGNKHIEKTYQCPIVQATRMSLGIMHNINIKEKKIDNRASSHLHYLKYLLDIRIRSGKTTQK